MATTQQTESNLLDAIDALSIASGKANVGGKDILADAIKHLKKEYAINFGTNLEKVQAGVGRDN